MKLPVPAGQHVMLTMLGGTYITGQFVRDGILLESTLPVASDNTKRERWYVHYNPRYVVLFKHVITEEIAD